VLSSITTVRRSVIPFYCSQTTVSLLGQYQLPEAGLRTEMRQTDIKSKRQHCNITCLFSRDFACVGYIATSFIDGVSVWTCYPLNGQLYCYYSNSSELLSWGEAREFCAKRNSTLAIITDKYVDNTFQQFIVSNSNSCSQNRSVWIAAHARPVNSSVRWHWINGKTSGNLGSATAPQVSRKSTQLLTFVSPQITNFDYFCDPS